MRLSRTLAVVERQWYLMRGSPTRIVPLFGFVAIDILLWGFITRYLDTTSPGVDFIASLLEIHKNYWKPANQDADFPRLLPSGFGGNNYLLSSQWIRSAAYFRIKNVNIGYRLPASVLRKINIASARVFVSGSNLATFSRAWKGFDPEINSANAEFYPLMRTWTAGVNINF